MEFSTLARSRRSIRDYDPTHTVTDADLRAIFEDVVLSPSSFNLQHWTFVVVRDAAVKKQLRDAASGQQQVETAPAVILVCGKLNAHQDAARIYAETPNEIRERLIPMIHEFYGGNALLMRDEAIRSASLAAMSLMYAAKSRGFDTGPMIGFDSVAVSRLLNLDDNYIPVMMMVLGHKSAEPRPREYRRPLSEVVRLERLDGAGLDGA